MSKILKQVVYLISIYMYLCNYALITNFEFHRIGHIKSHLTAKNILFLHWSMTEN